MITPSYYNLLHVHMNFMKCVILYLQCTDLLFISSHYDLLVSFLYTLLSLEVHLVAHLSNGSPYFLSFAMNIGYELLYSIMLWF